MVMKIKKKMIIPFATFLLLTPCFGLALVDSGKGMVQLSEEEMRGVNGQGLFVSDHIAGNDPTLDGGTNEYAKDFDFYRIGLDGEMSLNLNISKLQLGCGGVNDMLSGVAGCDIDIDYASMMGRIGTEPGVAGSAFRLLRPYMSFAIKNDDSKTLREVAGIKIGAQSADGAMVAGRRYANGEFNHENTVPEFGNACDTTGGSTGTGVVGCHSGINTVSGFLGTELSIAMQVRTNVCALGFGPFSGNCLGPVALAAWGCAGRTDNGPLDKCGTSKSDALFVDLAGTRMQRLGLRSAELQLNDVTVNILGANLDVSGILGSAYAQLDTSLRTVHKLIFADTSDFFLSFQREPIAYPRYSKKSAYQDFSDVAAAGGTPLDQVMDQCSTDHGAGHRCSSAFSVPANTGWWLNAPSVKLLDITNNNAILPNVDIGGALGLLAAPGHVIRDPEFNLTPAQNCYGSSTFC